MRHVLPTTAVRQVSPAATDCAECRAGTPNDHLRSLTDSVSRGSREAFATLFDHTHVAVRAGIDERLSDPLSAAAVFAATYIEVWWLAGCHNGPDTDVIGWINHIAQRRGTEARPDSASAPTSSAPTTGGAVEAQSSRSLADLSSLLGRPVNPLTKIDLGRC
jgi:RNA polymerase sigma-70 factor, ECF subfamily